MTIFGLQAVDIAAIIAYFVVVLYIGYRSMKRINNQEDYFLAGRKFGRCIQTFAAFGQGTSAESAVTSTTMVATNGASGIGAMLATGLLNLPIFWMITMWFRRLRLMTLADFFEERYQSKAMAGFYAFCQAIFFILVAAMGFSAMSKTVSAIAIKPDASLTIEEKQEKSDYRTLMDLESRNFSSLDADQQEQLKQLRIERPRNNFSYINSTYLMVIIGVIVLLYAVSGGLEAAFVTDMIQGIFIIILTVILIPFAMIRINQDYGYSGLMGPFKAMHEQLPSSFFQILGSPSMAEITWYWILAFSIMGALNTAVQANQLTAAGSARDDETARVGFLRGIFIKRYCTVIWGFVAMMTLVLYGNKVTDPDMIWGHATRDLLGPLGIGLVGLMIACLLAALMSTADALMLTTSALLTRNVYRPLVPGKSEKHYVMAGRFFALLYISGGILLAIAYSDVFGLFKFMLMFNCIIAAAFWLGMVWRRANTRAGWASMIITFIITLLLPVVIPMIPGVRDSKQLAKITEPYIVTNTYIANKTDVEQRQREIAKWESLDAAAGAETACPSPLILGQSFERDYQMPGKSIFWQKGLIKDQSGNLTGGGMLKVELVALDMLGWDLARNTYSFNETMTALLRILIPFGSMIIVSLLTKPQDKIVLDRFYAKMRTAVSADHDEDARQMALSIENPERLDHLRLFPNSNWEFRRWTRRDYIGHLWTIAGIVGILMLIYLIVNVGR